MRGRQRIGNCDGQVEHAGKRQAAGGAEFEEAQAFDEFHGEEVDAILVLNREECDDIGVVEPGENTGLTFKAIEVAGGTRERVG